MTQPTVRLRRWSLPRLALTIVLSALAWAALAAACLTVGSTGGFHWPTAEQWPLRSEAVLTASLVGAALGSAGAVYQAILANPLADPYLLGASSGAALAAYLWRFPFLTGLLTAPIWLSTGGEALSQQLFAFLGALLAVGIVFLLAGGRGRLEPVTLLLVGVIVNAVNGSIFLLVDAVEKNLPSGSGPLTFLVGSIQSDLSAAQRATAGAVIGVGWLLLLLMAGKLNAAGLDETEARSLGVNLHRLRWGALLLASLITAAAVAISGPIGFIGLVCPHLARLVVGRDQRILFPAATAAGAALLAIADAASRSLSAAGAVQTLLPVGVLTGLLGGPFFLLLLWQRRREVTP